MTPVLEASHLSVTLTVGKKRKQLVKDSSFAVYPGECLGILGESGSGKSMTVKSMLGLLDQHFSITGKALFYGKDLLQEKRETLRAMRGKDITMVLQNPMTCFDPLYRIGNQMAETFAAHTNWSPQKIQEESLVILERMQIQNPKEALQKYPHQLSGGMLQRIMIGLAVALKPKLLIADEPTTAIDAITQKEILDAFLEIKQEHQTAMIFITHDLGAIAKVADRLLVMNQGEIVDEGTYSHILHHAQDRYTKLLIEKRQAVMGRYQQVLGGMI